MLILGIDPGLKGAICALDTETGKLVLCQDLPVKGNRIDAKALSVIVASTGRSTHCLTAIIEKVHGRPRQAGVFNFGFSTGQVYGVLETLGVSIEEVHPSIWKAQMGLSSDKNLSRLLAQELFPESKKLFSRAKDDGRAEAALLAVYASKNQVIF